MDDLGNRVGSVTQRDGVHTYSVDSLTNRYTQIDSAAIGHDEAGNQVRDRKGYRYQYDYENRIVRIYRLSGPTEVTVATFDYDALGRRIRKVDPIAGATTLYYYDPEWRCLEERDGAGALQATYVYGNYIDEILLMDRLGTTYYYLHDHLYSPTALLDGTGAVVERYEYDAYGTVHVMDAGFNPRSATAYGNPYTFTGRRLDRLDSGNLKLMYYRHRYYEPYVGRFLQQDPLGHFGFRPEELHADGLQEYCKGNPVSRNDPSGLIPCDGGEWWFGTKVTVRSLIVVDYASGPIKWVCKRRLRVATEHYCCGLARIEVPIYKQPCAEGFTRSLDLAIGIGGAWFVLGGTQPNAPDSSDLDKDSWHGMSVQISAVIVGGQVGGGQGGAGISPGFGGSVGFFGKTWNSVRKVYWSTVRSTQDKALLRRDPRCKLQWIEYEGFVWEDSNKLDLPPIPDHWYE